MNLADQMALDAGQNAQTDQQQSLSARMADDAGDRTTPAREVTFRDIPGIGPDTSETAPEPSLGERIIGAGEAGLSTLTGMVAAPIAAARGGVRLLNNAIDAATGRPISEDIPGLVQQTREALTYTPRTAAGREDVGAIGSAIEGLKLAPVPELAMLPGSASTAEGMPLSSQMSEAVSAARNELLPSARTVEAPFSTSSLSPKVPVPSSADGSPVSAAVASAAAPIAGVATRTAVTGPMQRAAQTLIDESGLPADQLSVRLRTASAATPDSLPPTTGNLIGGKVASLEKALRADADVKDVLSDSDLQRTQAQLKNITGRFGGSDDDLLNLKNARSANSQAWTGEGGYLNNPDLKVDAQPIIDQINASIKSPIGRDTAVNKGLKSVIGDISDIADENGHIDIGNLDAIRQKLRDTIAQNSTNGIVGSKTDVGLNPIRNAITSQIESAVPGYRDYLAQYASDSKKINTMEAANAFRDWTGGRPLVDPDGTPSLSYQATSKQLTNILNQEGGVDPALEQAVNAMHQDIRRSTVVATSQRQAGSDTLANLTARSRLAQGVGMATHAVLPGAVTDIGGRVISSLTSAPGLQAKQALAHMMADPRFAADVIDSMGK